MQGRTDEPLNETGIQQAEKAREMIGNISFDAVYASPLQRAVLTASIIGNTEKENIITDSRLTEVEFGKYELKKYYLMGPVMTAHWVWPEVIPAPATVESVSSMVERSSSILKEIEAKDYENVLIVCHGGIIRALRGYLTDSKNGIQWRPKPHNCEVRVYESVNGKHTFLKDYRID
jgi:alpha-ribazole phosphatase/probable phosphoglycerate mutase